ncbi:polyprenyl synthetase family protein [Streptomyces boncukensis]|nr:polyprenyl synthetase family protein [Streptomyces boncukensis]
MRALGLDEHADTLRTFLIGDGGKRMRALFCYWGWRGAGGSGSAEAVQYAAAALEVNHSAFLIHDDLIDRSELRRGRPALYRHFGAHHAAHQWGGSADAYGSAAAVNLGDLCFDWARDLLNRCADGACLHQVLDIYRRMYTDAVYGQVLEAQIQADQDFRLERCLAVATHKAARYMMAPPLRIGAAVTGADQEVHAAYQTFGSALGEAYQLRDDLLGAFGTPSVTGKPNLDDLREGKPTVLFATALRTATPLQRDKLLSCYGDPGLDTDAADELRALLHETGAPAQVEERIRTRSREAARALKVAPITGEARTALNTLAAQALYRER